MQFVKDGPDIPDEFLHAHELGKIVFFCGAGISCYAGLPTFKQLIKSIYSERKITPTKYEIKLLRENKLDILIEYIDSNYIGHRIETRKLISKILQLNLKNKNATKTHEAILILSRNNDKKIHLVTTNYDHLFSKAAELRGISLHEYKAPLLPVPKTKKWDGLVYLHGKLPKDSYSESDLNHIVISSGDFGLAYLTERWASRFLTTLLQNYIVCFVGYSINDPVLRYMMDTISADRLQGEVPPVVWVMSGYKKGQKEQKEEEWRQRGIKPILYKIRNTRNSHILLHQTLGMVRDIFIWNIWKKQNC